MKQALTRNGFNSRSNNARLLWLLVIILSVGFGAIVLLFIVGGEDAVFAEADDMQKARETYPHILGTRLDSCNLCHTGTQWDLNDYGRDYKQQGRDLTAINNWDSDNDGFDNIKEITALSFPGDASDVPPAEPTPSPEPTPKPQTNLAITKQAANSAPLPGETIIYMLTISNVGSGMATDIVVNDPMPAAILAPTWSNSASLDGIMARPGKNFLWDLPDMAPGVIGVITVSGQLDPDLPKGSAVVNKATVSSFNEDSDISDNEDMVTVFVGGERIYLPVILRD